MRLVGSNEPVMFELSEQGPGSFVGIAKVGDMTIKRETVFEPSNSSFKNTITITNPSEEIKKGFSLVIPEKIHRAESSSMLFPSYSHQDFFIGHSTKTESLNFSSAKENLDKVFENAHLVSVGSQYFTALVFDKSQISPNVKLTAEVAEKKALAEVTYKPVQLAPEMKFTEIFYVGPNLSTS